MFRYLKYSLVLILAFVGVKMLLHGHFHVPNLVSLGLILGTLAGGVLASLWATRREERARSGGDA
jgi:tellurite resistance protein TerC